MDGWGCRVLFSGSLEWCACVAGFEENSKDNTVSDGGSRHCVLGVVSSTDLQILDGGARARAEYLV